MKRYTQVVGELLANQRQFQQIVFAGDKQTPPSFSYQVNFPRIEWVLEGTYHCEIDGQAGLSQHLKLLRDDALYIPPNCWNKPDWQQDCEVLSILFGRRQLGISLIAYSQEQGEFSHIEKHSTPARTGHAIDNMLGAMNGLASETQQAPMASYQLSALISYVRSMQVVPEPTLESRSSNLYQSMCIFIQENYQQPISRESIAAQFHITPSHVSRLFRQHGYMRLADYITWVRIDRAKFMLKKYALRLEEVALRCGFQDPNYFYRVFKKKTGMTPSQYRGTRA
ncbi:AraC family transcriptional regulator [Aliagarivorans taiwanensis]|uniref:AraC family transcriptional regulator n=1 Tax=Aliagarivorans taiwanensis TaxID=561966 RepID=UPI0003FEBB3E|nr:AraC family transcriptional regulator [Aliagarivorans taiwanensis]